MKTTESISQIVELLKEATDAQIAAAHEKGLVAQSGDDKNPGRWVTPYEADGASGDTEQDRIREFEESVRDWPEEDRDAVDLGALAQEFAGMTPPTPEELAEYEAEHQRDEAYRDDILQSAQIVGFDADKANKSMKALSSDGIGMSRTMDGIDEGLSDYDLKSIHDFPNRYTVNEILNAAVKGVENQIKVYYRIYDSRFDENALDKIASGEINLKQVVVWHMRQNVYSGDLPGAPGELPDPHLADFKADGEIDIS